MFCSLLLCNSVSDWPSYFIYLFCCSCFSLFSSWVCALPGIQRLVKLLFGECGRHADSGSYSSVCVCVSVCVDVCVYRDAFLLFHTLKSTHWRQDFLPWYDQYLISLVSSPLLSSPFVLSNILTFIPPASKGWGKDSGRGKCVLSCSLFLSVSFLSRHPSVSSELYVGEQVSHSFHEQYPLNLCKVSRYQL